ncbi:hypothetical protein Ddye_016997 [Dipteronia dyeriana]|uniref:Large ribosomal subunit protein eL19 domain-containing protein n=1 Tax=Dipteronia dyeriana TaxID=168575 RepID=A0AAD9U8H7_9ROSI|nr:hypothetical protein Ddye_016997 [Dipteronia dyeriana]
MVSLKFQKWLSANVLQCQRGKVWLDPNENNEIYMANSPQNIRNLVKDGLIIRKSTMIHYRSQARCMKEAKKKGHLDMVKGNVLKNNPVLMESIPKLKAEQARKKTLSYQFEAKVANNKTSRER